MRRVIWSARIEYKESKKTQKIERAVRQNRIEEKTSGAVTFGKLPKCLFCGAMLSYFQNACPVCNTDKRSMEHS